MGLSFEGTRILNARFPFGVPFKQPQKGYPQTKTDPILSFLFVFGDT